MIIRVVNYTNKQCNQYDQQRQRLDDEINGKIRGDHYVPKVPRMSFEVFAKNEAEKANLKDLKYSNKQYLLRAGLDPKKFMNDPNSNMGVKVYK